MRSERMDLVASGLGRKKKTVTTWAVGKSWLWNSMDLWIYYGYNWDLCILNPTGGMMFPSIISIS